MRKFVQMSVIAAVAAIALASAPSAMARRGADDTVPEVHQPRGMDDPAGHARQASNAADRTVEVRQARGVDDPATHDANEVRGGADDPANHDANEVRGGGADDPANHDANDDRGGSRGR